MQGAHELDAHSGAWRKQSIAARGSAALSRLRSPATWELLLLLGTALLLGRALGPGRYASPDSASYLNAAEHLAHGDGYVTSALSSRGEPSPLSCFAPLFSLLIALPLELGVAPLKAIADAVLASFVLYAGACYALLKALLPASFRRAVVWLALCLLCLPGSVSALHAALSDLLGAATVLFASARLLKLRPQQSSAGVGLLFSLSVLARWSNLYFVLAASVGVLTCGRELALRARFARALTLVGTVLLVLAPIWLRNLARTGSAMGPRPTHISGALEHSERAFSGLFQPLFEAQLSLHPLPALAYLHAALVVVVVAGIVICAVQRREPRTDLCWWLAFGYAALLVGSSARTHFDSLAHPRFWLALSPLLLAACVRTLGTSGAAMRSRLALALGALLLVHIAARGALGAARQRDLEPVRSGLFASHLAASTAVHSALALADAGQCELAATHAFWLYPQIGLRPIRWLTAETHERALRSLTLCIVLLREPAEYNSESVPFHQRMLSLAARSRSQLLASDELVEVWLMRTAANDAISPLRASLR